ncbi:MAG: carbohydrate-binding domain-containing protein, partial [Atopobiaceae bacterium]|nr:carbohydrate-binding domain-containing protein [Atopobiaceae bacterium]
MRTRTKTRSLLSTALAMVLSLTMTAGLCPTGALAAALEEDVAPVELEEGGGEAPAEGAEDGAGIQPEEDGGEVPAEGAEDGAGIQPEEDGEDALVVQGQEAEGEAELLPQEEPLVLEGGASAEPDEDAEDALEAQGQEAGGEVALQPQGDPYELWVGGTQVSGASPSGAGWSYDAASSTLTLDGYSYSGDGHGFVNQKMFGQGYAAVYAGQDLTIQLSGKNTLTNEKSYGFGVYVAGGDLTITGTDDGTLDATGGTLGGILAYLGNVTVNGGTVNATGKMAGIYAYNGNVTVNGGTVNATGNEQSAGIGIFARSVKDITSCIAITIIGGSVTATGDRYGMSAYGGDVTIAGGVVTATATGNSGVGINAQWKSNSATQQTFGGNLTISGGTVTASGKVRGIIGDDSVSFATGVSARAGEDEGSAQPVADIGQWSHSEKWIRLELAHTHAVGEGEGAQTITFRPWTDALAAQQHGWGPGNPNTEYTAANSLPTEEGNYLLTKDVKLSGTWTVPEGETNLTNLCLGGKTITGDLSSDKNVIDIPAGRTLNLYDDEEGTGEIVSKNYEVSGQPAKVTVVRCGGAFTMNGGTLSSVEGEEVQTGVYVQVGATFTMNGGAIRNADRAGVEVNADGKDAKGTFTMNGGTITGCATGVFNNGTFTMSGGTITGCATGVWDYGTFTMSGDAAITENTGTYGGVLASGGTFNMQGGTISKNAALVDGTYGDGGGVYVQGGTFTMSGGGTISENTANRGGGVYVQWGTFDMQGGSITQNQAKRTTKPGLVSITFPGDGGGVYVEQGTFDMRGGSITGNSAEDTGDGVCVYLGTFNLSGSPDISGNGGQNVYLGQNARITVAGALSNTTPIGVTMYEPGVFTTSTDPKAKGYLGKFASDDDKYAVVAKGDELALQHNAHSLTYAASGATITATCDEEGLCDLTDKKVVLTIKAPTLTTYGQTGDGISERATLSGLDAFNDATGKSVSADSVRYFPARQEGMEVKKTGEALPKAPTDAGDYVAEVTLAGVKTGDSGVTAVTAYVTYTIAKATPAFEHFAFAPPADLAYDGQAKAASVTAKDGVEGMGAVTVGYYSDAACTAAAEPRGVGTYYVGVTVAEGDNFLATAGGEVLHGEGWAFRIAKEPAVAARVSANGRTYDGASRPLVKVEGEATGGKMQYALGKDAKTAPADGWSTSIPAATDAGTYHVWYRVRGDANHGDLAAKPVKATVAQREAKLAWKGTSFTYDGKSHAPTAAVGNLASGDKCSVTVAGAAKAAGSHTATATKLGNANYKLPAKATQAFAIAQREAKLAWKGTSFTYDGKSHAPTATVTNLASGDKCSVTVTGAAKAAGSHTATATKLSNANYKLPKKATQAFTIAKATPAKAKLTSIAEVAAKTYTGKAIKPTPAVKAGKATLKAGEDFTYSYKANVNAGTATVTAEGKGGYTGSVSTTFKIAPAEITSIAEVAAQGYT